MFALRNNQLARARAGSIAQEISSGIALIHPPAVPCLPMLLLLCFNVASAELSRAMKLTSSHGKYSARRVRGAREAGILT